MSPMDSIREMFIDMRDSLQQIVENTLETNELLKVGVLGTPAEQRDEAIARGETAPPPDHPDDTGPGFLERLRGLNPFQGGIGTFGKFLLTLAGILGLKAFEPQLKEGLEGLLKTIEENEIGEINIDDRDDLFEEAAKVIVVAQQGSASLIQRKLKLGYNRAGRIIDQMEASGIVGPFEGSKARQVLIRDEMALEEVLNQLNNQN